jgi:hypothetical protein
MMNNLKQFLAHYPTCPRGKAINKAEIPLLLRVSVLSPHSNVIHPRATILVYSSLRIHMTMAASFVGMGLLRPDDVLQSEVVCTPTTCLLFISDNNESGC